MGRGFLACYRWNEIEEEKKRGDVALEELSEELTKRCSHENSQPSNPFQ